MKTTTVVSVLAAASSAMAISCVPGQTYCGAVLLRRGNYHEQINEALLREGKPTNSHHVLESLFYCTDDEDYVIWKATCRPGKCQDAGTGRPDYCIGDPEEQ
ncbi:uncharacterized protein ATNIH1004_000597 [Aspergillus tanneri]|uniref:Uncharacterized protein n=1 Tax=Aspergillus tanneri TaxID=1220188 RepID=A0A5M9MX63_9EURO|nr:uncharacterized protein ATNIH1004_000597 [Aspergillus tanneri]KAA8651701.1 hypothetical protein ATNIH1004_000597 [Aspergillus tanneri]